MNILSNETKKEQIVKSPLEIESKVQNVQIVAEAVLSPVLIAAPQNDVSIVKKEVTVVE